MTCVYSRDQLHREASYRWAVQFGLKLPTGRFAQNFADGLPAGELLDRSLQLGKGTTDLLAGISWFDRPATTAGTFVQATVDQPLAARDDFLPSASLTLSGRPALSADLRRALAVLIRPDLPPATSTLLGYLRRETQAESVARVP